MNSVFEKAILSRLFYVQNHSFIAHDFFFKTFIPILFPYFLWQGIESILHADLSLYYFPTLYGRVLKTYYMQLSILLVQLRKAHLDITEKLLTGNLRN